MKRRLLAILLLVWPLLATSLPNAGAAAEADPLAPFLEQLSDSSDVYFGRSVVAFDTTGVDSLILARAASRPSARASAGRLAFAFQPVFGFHRATGASPGLKMDASIPLGIDLQAMGRYGFADHEGRYRFQLSRPLLSGARRGGAVSIRAAYARETVPFAPEHETPLTSAISALFRGRERQSVFERRGGSLELAGQWPGLIASVGGRRALDQPMAARTRFSLLGSPAVFPELIRARSGWYSQGFATIAMSRRPWPMLGADGDYASRDRWRARLAGAGSAALSGFEGHLQIEGGLSARHGPPQEEFELGGPIAIPTLGRAVEAGNRLLLAKGEMIHGVDLLRAAHLPHPAFLLLHPAVFAQGGAVWSAADGLLAWPGDGAWRGAAGFALVQLGIPAPTTYIRFQMGWPVGRRSGAPSFSVTMGRWDDLIPGI